MRVEPAPDGWFVDHGAGTVHLTVAWLEDMYHHQIKPRQATVDGRKVMAEGEREWNVLYVAVRTDTDTDTIGRLFTDFYDAIRGNRQARRSLGLKAVTKDGDEDLRAVREGAPVRPWNSTNPKSELHDWIKSKRATRNK